jgi:hypothetical protein
VKTDEQFLSDRLDMFETEGWLDLVSELNDIEKSVRDIDAMNDAESLWEAKGKLKMLNYIQTLEYSTKLAVEQS